MLSLNVKLSEVQLLRLRATFHTMPLFYLRTLILRAYARKNYAIVEIYPGWAIESVRINGVSVNQGLTVTIFCF